LTCGAAGTDAAEAAIAGARTAIVIVVAFQPVRPTAFREHAGAGGGASAERAVAARLGFTATAVAQLQARVAEARSGGRAQRGRGCAALKAAGTLAVVVLLLARLETHVADARETGLAREASWLGEIGVALHADDLSDAAA